MRGKLIIAGLMAATMLPGAAMADPPRAARQGVSEGWRNISEARRDDRRDVRRDDRRDNRREVRRDDRRDDWRAYRNRNRNVYRMPAYVGPRGYSYRAINSGYRLQPAYYAQRYWIADPYRYRLPRVGRNEQWVRYGNDVLLVDTRNGRVREVIRDFFW